MLNEKIKLFQQSKNKYRLIHDFLLKPIKKGLIKIFLRRNKLDEIPFNPAILKYETDTDDEIKLNDEVCIIYPVYFEHQDRFENFFELLKLYENFSSKIKEKLFITIVDDGSPIEFYNLLTKLNLNLSILKIKENIQWNSGGAKNLGACYTFCKKLIITDNDHFVPEETIKWAISKYINNKIFMFDRIKESSEPPYSIHPNSFLISKSDYFEIHGYNEKYSGMYGDDIPFRIKLWNSGKSLLLTKHTIIAYNFNEEKKSYKNSYKRIVPIKLYLKLLKSEERFQKMLNFNWKLLYQNNFENK